LSTSSIAARPAFYGSGNISIKAQGTKWLNTEQAFKETLHVEAGVYVVWGNNKQVKVVIVR